jgi:hypothetical protein
MSNEISNEGNRKENKKKVYAGHALAKYQLHIISFLIRFSRLIANNNKTKKIIRDECDVSTKNPLHYRLFDFIIRLGCRSRLFGP